MMQALVTSPHHCQSSLMKQVSNIFQVADKMYSLFVFHADIPGPVRFNLVTATLTSITISWTAPSDDNGAIVEYQIQFTYNRTTTTVNTTKEMYVLLDLSPDTGVEFSVRAVSVCGAVGVVSTTIEDTNAIREKRYTMLQKNYRSISN